MSTSADLMIGRYRVLRRIGAGGMAQVFLAENDGPAGFKRQVVIKKVHPRLLGNDVYVQLFLREARIASRLRHANVVSVLELGEQDGEYFIVMEYLDGLSLRHMAQRSWLNGESLPMEIVLHTLADAALGLHHAHTWRDEDGQRASLVHRDISPDNLMMCRDGVTKVLDFGLAKGVEDAADDLTSSSEVRGKVSYMSPEQLEGATLDGRADIFALGASLYWLLTARSPFKGATDAITIHNVFALEPPPPSTRNAAVSREIDGLVTRMLSKRPEGRPADALEVHEELSALAGSVASGHASQFAAHVVDLEPRERTEKFSPVEGFLPCVVGSRAPTQRMLADVTKEAHISAASLASETVSQPLDALVHELPTRLDPGMASTSPAGQLATTREFDATADDATAATVPARSGAAREVVANDVVANDVVAKDVVATGTKTTIVPVGTKRPFALVAAVGLVVGVLGAAALFSLLGPRGSVAERDPPTDARAPDDVVAAGSAVQTATTDAGTAVPLLAEPAPRAEAEHSPLSEAEAPSTAAEATEKDAGSVDAPPRETTSRTKTRQVRLVAPASVQWKHRGRTVARGSGRARLPSSVRALTAIDPKTGRTNLVPIVRGVASLTNAGKGKAFFLADPWANVRVGQRSFGTTPFPAVELSVGEYTATFEREGMTKRERFTVRKGKTTRVNVRMR